MWNNKIRLAGPAVATTLVPGQVWRVAKEMWIFSPHSAHRVSRRGLSKRNEVVFDPISGAPSRFSQH